MSNQNDTTDPQMTAAALVGGTSGIVGGLVGGCAVLVVALMMGGPVGPQPTIPEAAKPAAVTVQEAPKPAESPKEATAKFAPKAYGERVKAVRDEAEALFKELGSVLKQMPDGDPAEMSDLRYRLWMDAGVAIMRLEEIEEILSPGRRKTEGDAGASVGPAQ